MTTNYAPLLTKEDLKLAEDLVKNGPRVTIREIMRRQAIFPTSDAVRRRLNMLVNAGLGRWNFNPCSSQGGRPKECFLLTAPKREVEELILLLRRAIDPRPTRRGPCIYRDITALLNRHSKISSARLAAIFKGITASLVSNAEPDLDGLPRKYSVTRRGFGVSWSG